MSKTLPLTAVGRAAWLRRWTGGLQALRYHGLWAPGVRWLRNKSLPVKGATVLVCILLPVLLLLAEAVPARIVAWHARDIEAQRLQQFDNAVRLSRALHVGAMALFSVDHMGAPAELAKQALEQETRAFEQLQATRSGEVAAAMQSAWQVLQQRRGAFLAHRAQLDPTEPGAVSNRFAALDRYAQSLAMFRRPLLGGLLEVESDDGAMATVVLALMPDLADHLNPLTGEALLSLQEPERKLRARQLAMRLGAMQQALAAARPSLDRVRGRGLLDVVQLDEALRHVQAHLDLTDAIAANAYAEPDATGAVRPSPAAVAASGQRASDGVQRVYDVGVKVLQERHRVALAAQTASMERQAALVLASLLAMAYVLGCVYKVTGGGLRTLCHQLEQLGKGNLAIRPQGWGTDEVGRSLNALGASAARMSQLFEAVSHGVTAVSLASREVAEGNVGLSGRTGQIRHAIDDVAGRADEFSGAMDRCAGQVDEAAALVHEMQGDAQRSRKAMATLRRHMQALQVKSREIEKTVGLVQSVAYQTKLLSINASVEAARAGAAGKGFAVVAQEVRALAQRSDDAAKRIHTIVSSSVQEIEDGHLVTERANTAVTETDRRIAAIHRLMSEIVHLARDGRDGSQAMLDLTREVAASADGNAHLVAQLSEASVALRNQGDTLKRSVQHFVFA